MDINEVNVEIEKGIKSLIHLRGVDNTLHIEYDSICRFLLQNCRRQFSPAQLEKALASEIKKLEGKPICTEMFDEIARYINQMTIYMQQQGERLGQERIETMAKRHREFTQGLSD